MPIFTTSYLQNLLDQTEQDISMSIPIIFDRFSIATTAGIAEYAIPDEVIRILRVTYKGREVIPFDLEDFQQSKWVKPGNQSPQGWPFYYLRAGFNNNIKFQPIPSESITADDSVINTVAGIREKVIIACYRISNLDTLRLPKYLRRNIIKFRAMERAYAREGKTLNLEASKLFGDRYREFLAIYKVIIEKIPKAIQFQFGPSKDRTLRKPPHPVLPSSGRWAF